MNLDLDANTPISAIVVLVSNLFNLAIRSAAILLAILIVYGAVKLATSLGDPKGFDSSKKIFTFSILGFLVITLFFVFLRLIFSIIGIESDFLDPSTPFNNLIDALNNLNGLVTN